MKTWMNAVAAGVLVAVLAGSVTACGDDEPSEDAKRLPATIDGTKVDNKMNTDVSASRVEYFVKLVKERGGTCHTILSLQSRVKNGRGGFFMACDKYRNAYDIDKDASGMSWIVSRH